MSRKRSQRAGIARKNPLASPVAKPGSRANKARAQALRAPEALRNRLSQTLVA